MRLAKGGVELYDRNAQSMTAVEKAIAETGKFVTNNILFETGKATLKSESMEEIQKVADYMKKNPTARFEVQGHTDNQGSDKINDPLSQERAEAVVKALEGMDISDYSEKSDIDFISGLFKCFAKVVFLNEDKLNAVTGISGSSPAYFYLFIKYLIDAGVKNGLKEEDAKTLAVNTMIGSGKMIFENSDKSLDELIAAVCSKGGTTIEAVNSFNESDLKTVVEKAVNACVKRSEELEKLLYNSHQKTH